MPDDLVTPRRGLSAFEPTNDPDVDTVSQVMQVLGIGAQLSGHPDLVSEPGAPDRGLMAELKVPGVAALGDRRVSPDECDAYVRRQHGDAIARALTGPLAAVDHREARKVLWSDVRGSEPVGDERSRQVAAVAFLLAALHSVHEGELLRVAAASELTWQGFPVARRGTRSRQDDADQALMSVLEAGTASDSEDVRVMAGNALARLAEADEALTAAAEAHAAPGPADADAQNAQPLGGAGAISGAAESVIIHGTWANKGPTGQWWRPLGTNTFHSFLLGEKIGRSLYNKDDCFEWSGNDRNHQRYVAGKALRWWVYRPRGSGRLKAAFAHSHGGTVLMSAAAHQGLQVDLMVALACPDYKWGTNEALNIQANIPLIMSIRATHDAVLLADRVQALNGRHSSHGLVGGADKELSGVGHAGVHQEHVWRNEQLAQWVETEAANLGWTP